MTYYNFEKKSACILLGILCRIQIPLFLPRFYKTHTKFDADDVTPVEMMETNVTNTTVAMENITDYDITDITDIPSVEMISSSMPEEITNYGQTTIINIKNTSENVCDILQFIALFDTV